MAQEPELPIRLRVLDYKGGPIQYASVNLLRVFDGPAYGKVPEFSERTLEPRDFIGDFAEIQVGQQGRFVLRVGSELHAHTHSLPFDLRSDKAPEITVRMLRGAVLEGVVVDTDGRPIADAEVSTSQFQVICRARTCFTCNHGRRLELATRAKVRTNSQGKYRLDRLCFGDYHLSITHDEYCHQTRFQHIADEVAITLPQIELQRGCAVEGVVTLDGVPTCGARVSVRPKADAADESAVLREPLHTLTDANGRYSFGRRVPAGVWTIQAAAAAPSYEGMSAFVALSQLKESQRPLQLHVGSGHKVGLVMTTPEFAAR